VAQSQHQPVECHRCGHNWEVDLSKLGKPNKVIFKNETNLPKETFSLKCPNCHTLNMLDLPLKEK
jgi:hypothetical protein